MTRLLTAGVAATLALLPIACKQSNEGGTPGTNQTFTLSVPPGDTNIKRGEEKTIVVTVRRDNSFTQPVKLKADSQSPKIDATLNKTTMEAADRDVTLTVKAAADAPTGVHVIKVTGTPQSGTPTSLDVRVEVPTP